MDNLKQKKLESVSYKSILVAAGLIVLGLLLGSFVQYTILFASAGSILLLIGIILYIASQMVK